MKKTLLIFFIIAAIGLLSISPSLLASESDSKVFITLNTSIENLQVLYVSDHDFDRSLLDGMRSDAKKLEAYYSDGQQLQKKYAANIENISDALTRVVKEENLPKEKKISICKAVARDLVTKVEYANTSQSNPFGNIQLTVRTVDGWIETNGCEVWYVPEAWMGTKEKYERFSTLSSPVSELLPPGYYRMWSSRDGHDGRRKPVTVRGADTHIQKVDLPAPHGS